jgi:exodeoxyribonuclease-3
MVTVILHVENHHAELERHSFRDQKRLARLVAAECRYRLRQELKAQRPQRGHAPDRRPDGYFHYAEKKGYSGVGLYARRAPERVTAGIGVPEFDAEGRYLRADWPGLTVISLYVPSGSSSPERQAAKFRFMEVFQPHLAALRSEAVATGREIVLCGDWNIAHTEKDLKNWKSNQKNSGFYPRNVPGSLGNGEMGWSDAYRQRFPDVENDAYTWWSNRGRPGQKMWGGASITRLAHQG